MASGCIRGCIRFCPALSAGLALAFCGNLPAGTDGSGADGLPAWPAATMESKPWAYNWWMGSAVDGEGLELQCREMAAKGFGGFHVIPIYGAKGWEGKYREYLSAEWVEGWNMAVRTARRHGLGVDLTMGSGWCFGGPWISEKDACSSGMKVKRAGPGGMGYMVDPFSASSMSNFVAGSNRFSEGTPGAWSVPAPSTTTATNTTAQCRRRREIRVRCSSRRSGCGPTGAGRTGI